jgi:hypothetical protein
MNISFSQKLSGAEKRRRVRRSTCENEQRGREDAYLEQLGSRPWICNMHDTVIVDYLLPVNAPLLKMVPLTSKRTHRPEHGKKVLL